MTDPSKIDFATALNEELADIHARRRLRAGAGSPVGDDGEVRDDTLPTEAEVLEKAEKEQLVGLALSGGGIRSATFALGLIQGLAQLRLLGLFDYLSTVSGGGYIGAWLAAWIKRARNGFEEVERQLQPPGDQRDPAAHPPAPEGSAIPVAPQGTQLRAPASSKDPAPPEAAPVVHLRRYSNYLAPRLGLFSSDRWALWAICLRNFLLNQCLFLLPMTVLVLLASRGMLYLYYPRDPEGKLLGEDNISLGPIHPVYFWIVVAASGFCWAIAFALLFSMEAWVRPSGAPLRSRALFVLPFSAWVLSQPDEHSHAVAAEVCRPGSVPG